ncbi:MAG TPA: PIG-L family deacetylase [Solirubrobacteraceae bacterium]
MSPSRPHNLPRRLYQRARRRAAAREERSFQSGLRSDPQAPALLLSPHWDDAVLDCWAVLAGRDEVNVVNVFAGVPEPGRLTLWDAITGAEDSAERARERLAEDALALAAAGRRSIALPFLDTQYRRTGPPALGKIDRAVTVHVREVSRVYAPAALGSHPDHVLARRYARMLALGGVPVTLYADLPYCILHGWPHWVDGRAPDPHRNVDAFWLSFLEDVPEMPPLRSAEVVRLTPEQAAAKLAAMQAYRTQYPALSYGATGLLDDPALHGFEVRWNLPAPASASPQPASS